MPAPLPDDEAAPLDALHQYPILDAELDTALEQITQVAARLCGTPMALVCLVEGDGRRPARGDRQWLKGFGFASPAPQPVASCARTRLPGSLQVSKAEAEERFADIPLVGADPSIRFHASVPLHGREGQALGSLWVLDRIPRTLTPEQLETLQVLAQNVVAQLELRHQRVETQQLRAKHQRLQEQLQTQAQQARLFAELALKIRQSLQLEEILTTTVAEVRQFLQTDRVFIYRFEPDWSGVVVVESVGNEWSSILGTTITDTFFGTRAGRDLYTQGRIQATADIYAAGLSPCHINLLAQLQIQANLVVPILQGEHLWGLLVANHCAAPRQWQSWEIDLLQQLSTQVAIAIQQAQLYQQAQAELVERQRTEADLRSSEERYRSVVAALQEGIVLQDADGTIRACNASAERILGLTAAQMQARTSLDARWQAIREDGSPFPGVEHPAMVTLKTGQSCSGVVMGVYRPDGNLVWISVNAQPLFHPQGSHPYAVVTSFADITHKKQLEAQFLRAQRMESIGTLASGIAHDLNNVLTPILMAVELLQRKLPDEKSQRLLSTLNVNARRGADLIKQVLSFARGLEGKRTTLQMKHLILEITKLIEETFPKNIRVKTEIVSELWPLSGDATQLHQVLVNLCINARDAMPQGGQLHLKAINLVADQDFVHQHLEAKIGPYVVVTVADTGHGIAQGVLDRIFEPFFTTKAPGQGTGLGLSTVTAIVKSHGGFIQVESEESQGTQFQIYLPATPTSELHKPEATPALKGKGELVLVVDDEAPVREVTTAALEANGYRVITAKDGIEAVTRYLQDQATIDLVLIDMMMPSMDGPMTIRMLQDINPQVKLVAMSGLAASNKAAPLQPDTSFLTKPFTTGELLEALHQALGG